MSRTLDKTPLKSKTASSHLRTVKRATEVVNSWPAWKRSTVVFRENSGSQKDSKTHVSGTEEKLKKRTA